MARSPLPCILAAIFMAVATPAGATPVHPPHVGVNIAGGEFTGSKIPGTLFKDYIYPDNATIDYFLAQGMNTLRVPFRWERLQPALGGALDAVELSRIDAVVGYATSQGASVILDPHNFGRYYGERVGSAAVPAEGGFGDFWSRVADHYQANDNVIFGLMNEPHGIAATDWAASAQVALDDIRATGADNLVLVPGTSFTGAHSWLSRNADAFAGFTDPLDNMAYEVHQYLDADFSGTSATCRSETIGVDSLTGFTGWLRDTGSRGFLGEFGVGPNATCLRALDLMLDYLTDNGDVWDGWTYWAAGAWWPTDYPFSVQPRPDGSNNPQMAVLAHYASLTTGRGPASIPEPATYVLLATGILALAVVRRRRTTAG